MFLAFLVLMSWMTTSSYSLDTLKQGESLNSSQLLVSANKFFTLGFFSPPNFAGNIYLAIWFSNVTIGTVINGTGTMGPITDQPVWIGNRNKPFHNETVVLSLDNSGRLVIGTNRTDFIELYSGQSRTNSNTTATLLSSGNFVLRETNANGSAGAVLWQSFDYPTDTLLPGMKLGINHRTGRNWTLTSWVTKGIPSDGAFTLDWDPSGPRLVVRYRGVIHWASGNSKDKPFEFIPTDELNLNYRLIHVSNEDEEYFSYSLIPIPTVAKDVEYRGYISGWIIDYMGRVGDQERPVAINQGDCYGYNTRLSQDLGCQLWEQPKCRHSYQKFELRSGGFRDPPGESSPGPSIKNESLGLGDCREICWKDCDCVGYMGMEPAGCIMWRGTHLTFEQDNSGSSVKQYVLISNPPKGIKKIKKWIWAIIAASVCLVMLLLGILCYKRRKMIQAKKEELRQLMTLEGYTDTVELENKGDKGQDVKDFGYSSILEATNGFSSKNKLGEGGFGPVYKGKLPDGQKVAVKRLSSSSGQGLLEFKTELILIAKLQHRNLVRLFGYCIHNEEKMLVYEYMPNKSLDFFLFDETQKVHLPWDTRFSIIEGIAQGLLYLHKYSRFNIVHRDLKASNILLDDQMNPKISDFGTARIFKQNSSEANTIKIAGTRGYMAPEYMMEGNFSTKSDVFSFGVLLLEIVSGQKASHFYDAEQELNLVAYAWDLWNRDAAVELMDPALVGSCTSHNQLLRCIHIGLLCMQNSANDRPTMSDVLSMLSIDYSALPQPKRPAFIISGYWTREDQQIRKSDKVSVNGLSISSLEAR